VNLGNHIAPVDHNPRASRSPERDVQDRSVFGHVNAVAPEHGIDPLSKACFVSQIYEELESFVGDAVFE
jgi:hypothetical protein